MALWSLNRPPKFKNPKGKELVATKRGWTDPDSGEVLVAISNLTSKAGGADVLSLAFDEASYSQGQAVEVIVHFNEKVDVTPGATIEASWDGTSGNFTLTAGAHNGVFDVVFAGTIPSETGTLSIAAQSIIGTIVDDENATPANLAISASAALAAGEREVA